MVKRKILNIFNVQDKRNMGENGAIRAIAIVFLTLVVIGVVRYLLPYIVIWTVPEGEIAVPSMGVSMCESVMNCAIPSGALVYIRQVGLYEAQRLEVGDIACYRIDHRCAVQMGNEAYEGYIVCHRVVAKGENGYLFKGDNPQTNPKPDPCVIYPTQIVGRVEHVIPYLGSYVYTEFLRQRWNSGVYFDIEQINAQKEVSEQCR